MPTFTDDPVWTILNSGTAFATRQHADSIARWSIDAGGTVKWSDGTKPIGTMVPKINTDIPGMPRLMFELTSSDGLPVGINLNQEGATLSITAQDGALVIRNEYLGADHIFCIISEDGISFPRHR